jgi:hypothetical protein
MLGEAPDRSFSFVVLVLLLALLIPPARTRKDYENEERGRVLPPGGNARGKKLAGLKPAPPRKYFVRGGAGFTPAEIPIDNREPSAEPRIMQRWPKRNRKTA